MRPCAALTSARRNVCGANCTPNKYCVMRALRAQDDYAGSVGVLPVARDQRNSESRWPESTPRRWRRAGQVMPARHVRIADSPAHHVMLGGRRLRRCFARIDADQHDVELLARTQAAAFRTACATPARTASHRLAQP